MHVHARKRTERVCVSIGEMGRKKRTRRGKS